jgi:GTP cyclohydrolase II
VVRREAATRLPTRHGELLAHGYRDARSGAVHPAVVLSGVDVTAMEPLHLHKLWSIRENRRVTAITDDL